MLCNKQKKWKLTILLMAVAVFLLAMAPVTVAGNAGVVIHVDAGASGNKDGSSWTHAYIHLQDALAVATPGQQIWVAAGTYKPDESDMTPGSRTATFQLIHGVAIYGGFAGGETSLAERDWQTNETILSGDLLGDDEPDFANNSDNSFHVVTGSGTDSTAMLDGFTITAGNANGFSMNVSSGGGMYNENGSPTVTNCTFGGNSARHNGGGMYNTGGSPTVTNCTFSENSAFNGGGIVNYLSNPTVTNCTFSGNSVISDGGGMYNTLGSATITNCTFSGNSAPSGGGGVTNDGCSPTVANCTFSGNSAVNAGGGGMQNLQNSNPTVTDCTFSNNSANYGGGMITVDFSNPTLTNCMFSGNSATSHGGGMLNSDSSLTLTNCTFAGNSASNGNTMAFDSHSQCCPSTVQLANCIIWDGGAEIWNNDGSTITITYSDIAGGYSGIGNISADPCFVNPSTGDYHLKASSPCIDAGDNGVVPYGATDLDGNPRIVDGDGVVGAIVDMGVFEVNVVSTPEGPGVEVSPVDPVTGETPVTLTFDDVTDGGVTAVTSTTPSEEQGAPQGFKFGNPPVIYEISTTATFSGQIEICFDYSNASYGNEANLKLFHRTDGGWMEIPTSVNTVEKIICGTVASLSFFAVFESEFVDPVESLGELAVKVVGMNLQHGISNSLDAKLDAALKAIDDIKANNDVAAINTLQAFINAVEAQRGDKIPEADANDLIAAAQEIIALLSAE